MTNKINATIPARQRVREAAGICDLNACALRQLAYGAVDKKCAGAMVLVENLLNE
jgi:hypothetical protein